MTAKQMDAHERWWKCALFCFAVLLMLDLVYLGVARPSGGAKIACWLIAPALGYACIYAMRQLYFGGSGEKGPVDLPDEPYHSLCDYDD